MFNVIIGVIIGALTHHVITKYVITPVKNYFIHRKDGGVHVNAPVVPPDHVDDTTKVAK